MRGVPYNEKNIRALTDVNFAEPERIPLVEVAVDSPSFDVMAHQGSLRSVTPATRFVQLCCLSSHLSFNHQKNIIMYAQLV